MAEYRDIALPAGSEPILLTVYNDNATEIPDKTGVLFETVSGKQRCVVVPTASAGRSRSAGITVGAIAANSYGTICVFGPALALAGDTSASGTKLMISDVTDHMGEVIAATATETTEGIGMMLTNPTAQGDTCVVFVNPQLIPKAAA